jgi:ribonucleoside-triphosphate reductase
MNIKLSYDSEFEELMSRLKKHYGERIFEIDGIGEKQLDITQFSKNFFSNKVASDVSVDANSNVESMSVIVYEKEFKKSLERLNSYYMLWKGLKKRYGGKVAACIIEEQLSGDIYIHDFHGFSAGFPYCFNYSTYDILAKGLPMVEKIKCLPPKYLTAFKSQLEQFVVLASNSTVGATGFADLLLVMSYYVKNILKTKSDAHYNFATEEDCWKYVKEVIVSFIYTINQPMRSSQAPFTNISVYDTEFLMSLQENYIFPDGSMFDIDVVKKLQDVFLTVMNEELSRSSFTFPVTTAVSVSQDITR